MPTIQQSLNEAQWDAVSYCDGPSLVIAGAGSGKTRVLTYKIAYLIEQGMPAWQILALTFTNKAAREMNTRIADVVGVEAAHGVWSGTFHSIFARILRREAQYIDYEADYTIYDTTDARSLIKAIVKERGLDAKVYKPQLVAALISEAKNALVLPEQYLHDTSLAKRDRINGVPEVGHIYATYRNRCRAANAMDFDDLLLNTYLLFRDHKDVCNRYKERFAYILVDEYQDTNVAQHRIISLLTTPTSRICVVGDDAQSIYSFRGACIDNILGFQQQYPTCRLIKLERNYRSTQNIVDAANSLIRHNSRQIPKKVYSEGEVGDRIHVVRCSTDKDEAARVAETIMRLHRREQLPYDDIALLYRTNAQSRSFEEAFRTWDIPYRIYGGLSFYQRKEIKDIISYFRLVCNSNDEEAFKRIVNYPARGIGATTLTKLQTAAVAADTSLWTVAANPGAYGLKLSRTTAERLQNFVTLIADFGRRAVATGGYDMAKNIIRESGILADLQQDTSVEGKARMENVDELLNAIRSAEVEQQQATGHEVVPLADYIAQVALLTDADQQDDGTPKVTLMTVHAAKGLEFDAVFVTGMEDELFPGSIARFSPRDMEEERRLFYVALTRAKRFLYLTYAQCRYRYGNMEFSNPSPFLREIDHRYVDEKATDTPFGGRFSRMHVPPELPTEDDFFARPRTVPTASIDPGLRRKSTAWRPHSEASAVERTIAAPASPVAVQKASASASRNMRKGGGDATWGGLSVGDVIDHDRFGRGTVVAIEGSGGSTKACVDFDNAGRKNLLLKFARFTIVS